MRQSYDIHNGIRQVYLIDNSSVIFQLSPYEASWAASLLCLGAVFGAVPSGLISEYFGRKKTLLYLALPLLVSWILVASRYVTLNHYFLRMWVRG